jgi:hypothetical protein
MNEQKVKLPLPECEFQQITERFDKLESKLNYLLDTQRAILIRLENVEHTLSMLEIEKVMDDR